MVTSTLRNNDNLLNLTTSIRSALSTYKSLFSTFATRTGSLFSLSARRPVLAAPHVPVSALFCQFFLLTVAPDAVLSEVSYVLGFGGMGGSQTLF